MYLVLAATTMLYSPSSAFHHCSSVGKPITNSARLSNNSRILHAATDDAPISTKTAITQDQKEFIASQFTIQVCTSTSCSKRLKDVGLDQYHALGEVYAQAQAARLEKAMIIEDGGCQGGKNCKMGMFVEFCVVAAPCTL